MPVANPAMTYNASLDYNIAIEVRDSTAVHSVILEVARTNNLNIANGVPAGKIQIAAVIQGA